MPLPKTAGKMPRKIRQQIAQLEKKRTSSAQEIRLKLPSGLFLPVARTDLLELLTQQDKMPTVPRIFPAACLAAR